MEASDFETFRAAMRRHGFGETEARYDEAAFDSWFIVIGDPPAVRVVWDGKEGWLVVQQRREGEWVDVWLARDEADRTPDAVVGQLTLLKARS